MAKCGGRIESAGAGLVLVVEGLEGLEFGEKEEESVMVV